MKKTIDNIDKILALEEILKPTGYDIFLHSFTSETLPDRFLLAKSINQHDDGNTLIDGTAEVCIYAKNLKRGNDQSLPNLSVIKEMTNIVLPLLNDGQKNQIFFNSLATNIVNDADIRYHYNSVILETKSVNI